MAAANEPQRNPADLPAVTLGTNPLIALQKEDREAPAVRNLLALHLAPQVVG